MPGVGSVSAQRVLDFIVETADPIGEIANAPMPPRVGGEDWSPFVETVGTTCRPRRLPAELERARLWYEPHLDRMHEDAVGFDPTRTRPSVLLSIDPPYAAAPIPDLTTDLTPSSCCTSRWWRKTSVCIAIAALAVALRLGQSISLQGTQNGFGLGRRQPILLKSGSQPGGQSC